MWRCLCAPRFVDSDRIGEGGVGALAPPDGEVKEIFRGVTVGGRRDEKDCRRAVAQFRMSALLADRRGRKHFSGRPR